MKERRDFVLQKLVEVRNTEEAKTPGSVPSEKGKEPPTPEVLVEDSFLSALINTRGAGKEQHN